MKWKKIPHNLVVVKGDPLKALKHIKGRRFLPADPTPQVVRKVNRDAWVFKPDVSIVVAADFAHGRVVVRETTATLPPGGAHVRLEHVKRKLASIIREFVTQERLHRNLHVEPCKHPYFRIKKRRYCEGSSDDGSSVMRMAWFCTKCGVRMREVDETKIATVEEIVNAKKARAPKVRKVRELL